MVYRITTFILFLATCLSAFDLEHSLVCVSAKKRYHAEDPWQTESLFTAIGTGFVVAPNRVITNAHVVADALHITVALNGLSRVFTAKPFVIGHDCDLALLEIDDPEFSLLSEPVIFGSEVREGDEITAIGYSGLFANPIFTKGIASPSHHYPYFHSGAYLHCIQIDAAINPGHSGGPVIHHGKVVGVAFQKLCSPVLDNVGFMIPVSVVKHFLSEANHGYYTGFPLLPIDFQPLENPAIRRYFFLTDDVTGILVTETTFCSELKNEDIITKIDNIPIQNDGSIYVDGIKRDLFCYILLKKHVGDCVQLDILRQGLKRRCSVPITNSFSSFLDEPRVAYYVYAGLVFDGILEGDRVGSIRLRKVLPHDVNKGYQFYQDVLVAKIGEQPLYSLEDLIDYLESPRPYHILTLADGRKIVLDEKAKKKNKEILEKFQVTVDRFIP
ncbi:MAG: trypsin-like peptidase domain-containing protein [Chlamydiota bacterium]